MLSIATKNGIMVDVPEIDEEDTSKKFTITDNPKDIKSFLHENGYVVVKSAFTSEIVDELNEHWNQEVKKSSRAIYRQATGKLEKNVFSTQGWVMNPILNLQSLDPRYFGGLRACFREKCAELHWYQACSQQSFQISQWSFKACILRETQ